MLFKITWLLVSLTTVYVWFRTGGCGRQRGNERTSLRPSGGLRLSKEPEVTAWIASRMEESAAVIEKGGMEVLGVKPYSCLN